MTAKQSSISISNMGEIKIQRDENDMVHNPLYAPSPSQSKQEKQPNDQQERSEDARSTTGTATNNMEILGKRYSYNKVTGESKLLESSEQIQRQHKTTT